MVHLISVLEKEIATACGFATTNSNFRHYEAAGRGNLKSYNTKKRYRIKMATSWCCTPSPVQ